jgi:hypothetical protein
MFEKPGKECEFYAEISNIFKGSQENILNILTFNRSSKLNLT